MNRILNKILKERQGHYVHALEVETVYELEHDNKILMKWYSFVLMWVPIPVDKSITNINIIKQGWKSIGKPFWTDLEGLCIGKPRFL